MLNCIILAIGYRETFINFNGKKQRNITEKQLFLFSIIEFTTDPLQVDSINPLHLSCFILAYITNVTVYLISDLSEGEPRGSTDKE